MSNFHETTAQGFIKRATVAYIDGRYDDAAWFEKQVAFHRAQAAKVQAVAQASVKVERERCAHWKRTLPVHQSHSKWIAARYRKGDFTS